MSNNDTKKTVDAPETIAIKKITVSELNPRHGHEADVTSLAESIKTDNGLLQPILLRKTKDGYEVVAGSRRYAALKANRGTDGVLNADEFRIVDWDDDRCILAAVAENEEREDLPPIVEGRFLNNLADRLKEQGEKVSEELIAKKTGIGSRQRISGLRALADKFDLLPESWRKALGEAPTCRPGDGITATHWKHVRKYINGEVPKNVLSLMRKAAKDGWSATRFKAELKGLEEVDVGGKSTNTGSDNTTERDPNGDPDYKKVNNALQKALHWVGSDEKLATVIELAIKEVETVLHKKKEQAEPEVQDNQGNDDA